MTQVQLSPNPVKMSVAPLFPLCLPEETEANRKFQKCQNKVLPFTLTLKEKHRLKGKNKSHVYCDEMTLTGALQHI